MATPGTRSKSSPKKKTAAQTRALNKEIEEKKIAVRREVILISTLAIAILLFLCNFGIIGSVGDFVSSILFGIFGLLAYIVPVFLFVIVAFALSNRGNSFAIKKLIAAIVLFLLIGMILELLSGTMVLLKSTLVSESGFIGSAKSIYDTSSKLKAGGGMIAGLVALFLYHFIAMAGAMISILVIGIICIVVLTEKSFIRGVQKSSEIVYKSAKEESVKRKEKNDQRQEEKRLRMDNKVAGVMLDTTLPKDSFHPITDEIHEIHLEDLEENKEEPSIEGNLLNKNISSIEKERLLDGKQSLKNAIPTQPKEPLEEIRLSYESLDHIRIRGAFEQNEPEIEIPNKEMKQSIDNHHLIDQRPINYKVKTIDQSEIIVNKPVADIPEPIAFIPESIAMVSEPVAIVSEPVAIISEPIAIISKPVASITKPVSTPNKVVDVEPTIQTDIQIAPVFSGKEYKFPPIDLLKKESNKGGGETAKQLKETALQLQQTLATFGVKVTVTDISQGPSVTRFELQPEQGVKVSKIVGLADDIKLNLAAVDIRIEAPIPGKAAVGIEIPNKETSIVSLRELFETKDFEEFDSNIAFAVGKDISGKTIVSDIGKMPHMLIAGATGSGKSVCINTLIMSILYKAHPDDVKMIMIDPKVVELNVYNGIPHLLIPVVTEPKKASAALHWGVAEMTERYQKFADFNVRDLKGYNKKVERQKVDADGLPLSKMPQIVIIVDELADLMMVAPGEVESSICRLAQLARAAGIHLIIATQRPSVDVITGLIKANMPSRVAFSVSSGIDSRTILDMNGAEKLLGRGDMLFYPQGYPKPARIQGAFVSDSEVENVVDFLRNQSIGNVYDENISEKIDNIKNTGITTGSAGNGTGSSNGDERDVHFLEAGQFIIEKEKASIGMLQRVFKIGFNRASRIMDQLVDAGVVSDEEGTKARKVLLSMEEFELYIEENL